MRTMVSGMGTGTLGCRVPGFAHLKALQELVQGPPELRAVGHKHALLVQDIVHHEVHKGELGTVCVGGRTLVCDKDPPRDPPSTSPPTFSPANQGREPRNRSSSRSLPSSSSRYPGFSFS